MQLIDSTKKILAAHIDSLKQKYPIAQLALFGSITRNDFDPEKSDVDILVEFNGDIGIEFIDLADELEEILGRKVDLITKKGLKPRHWEYLKTRLYYV
ncbi:MAG: nucleotidyltransferase family protein [Chitinophagaceae bacterium]|nr:nucleotidyltransferase family protein [Chitinophagaceae bacterium]